MKASSRPSIPSLLATGLLGALLFDCTPAVAGPILSDTWLQFGFSDTSTPATGCDPADPAGPFCLGSSGTPTSFLDAPPWTFFAGAGGATLTIVDAFLSTDRFELFDFGVSLGLTSMPTAGVDCGDDPVVCLATSGMSWATFGLGAGSHSLTLIPTLSDGGGTGYLFVSGASQPPPTSVPEPQTWALALLGLLAIGARRMRKTA